MVRKNLYQVRCSAEVKRLIKEIQMEGFKRGRKLSEKEILDMLGKKFKENKGALLL